METNKFNTLIENNIFFPFCFNHDVNNSQIITNEGYKLEPFNFSQFFSLQNEDEIVSFEKSYSKFDKNEENLNSDLSISTNMSNKSSDSIKITSRKNSNNIKSENDVSSMLLSLKEINIKASIEIVKFDTFTDKKKKEIKLSEFIKSQKGSRIYQRKIKKMNFHEIDDVIKEILDQLPILLTNVYGNYFCQKLYTLCSNDQKLVILEKVFYNFKLDNIMY
jgi:hypothetical protein